MENFEVIKALFLGFVEGLTEFLPISSTGHLILFGHIIDFHSDGGRVFEVVIQLGAILAVCWLYRQKIINLIKGFFSGDVESRHFAISVLIAFFPAVIIGVLAVDFIKSVLFSPIVVAIALIVGALIIFWVESRQFEHKTLDATKITFKQALFSRSCSVCGDDSGNFAFRRNNCRRNVCRFITQSCYRIFFLPCYADHAGGCDF